MLIVSKVWLGVSEVVRGSSISSVSVDIEGGTLGGMTMRVSDLPEMKPGARALFLLGQLPDGSARLVKVTLWVKPAVKGELERLTN